ncbi:solute carrier family 23 protein [Shigella flexneri]
MIGGTFNGFPHTSFSQNVGLVSVTRVIAAGCVFLRELY